MDWIFVAKLCLGIFLLIFPVTAIASQFTTEGEKADNTIARKITLVGLFILNLVVPLAGISMVLSGIFYIVILGLVGLISYLAFFCCFLLRFFKGESIEHIIFG